MKIDGENFEALMADLEGAARDLLAAVERDPARWTRSRPGKWTVGQHVGHLALSMAATTGSFEERRPRVLDGTLGPAPRRGFLQWLWIALVVKRGTMPRGGRTSKRFEPGAGPGAGATIGHMRQEIERLRSLGAGLSPDKRDRLWIANPFMRRWHYTLPEIVRVHAVHTRHHAGLIAEIPLARHSPPDGRDQDAGAAAGDGA